MAQCRRGESESGGELFLCHTRTGAYRFHINATRAVDPRVGLMTPRVIDGLLQAQFDTVKYATHGYRPFHQVASLRMFRQIVDLILALINTQLSTPT